MRGPPFFCKRLYFLLVWHLGGSSRELKSCSLAAERGLGQSPDARRCTSPSGAIRHGSGNHAWGCAFEEILTQPGLGAGSLLRVVRWSPIFLMPISSSPRKCFSRKLQRWAFVHGPKNKNPKELGSGFSRVKASSKAPRVLSQPSLEGFKGRSTTMAEW